MPRFEIAEDAFKIITGETRPIAVTAALPQVSAAVQGALDDSERYTRPGTLVLTRRIAADRQTAKAMCDWFVEAEAALRLSSDSIDQTRSRMCGTAAMAIARAVPDR